MRYSLTAAALILAMTAAAQNPIIRDQFTADPTARVFNGKVYLYPSHDIPAPAAMERKDWFCMEDYHVFSSENLIDWEDHGVIVSQESVPWGKPDGYSMWAPDCVFKNGKYYFYFPNAPRNGRGFAIGVATADKPEGPFTLEKEPIKGVSGIDPCVLIDDDGQAYLYWSGMGIRGAKLNANMKELDGELTTVTLPPPANQQATENGKRMQPMQMTVGGQVMEGLPDGFKEGPFAFKRGNWYYLTFPWVRKENGTETLAYAMSKSPLGPWDFKGIIMAEHENGCWTNHHSLLEFKGQWYLFYHRNDYSPAMDKRRSARIEKVSFNADGTIKEVKPTLRGAGIHPATSRIDIDRYSSISDGTFVEFNDTTAPFRGWHASLPQKGSWISYGDVDFSCIDNSAYLIVCARAKANTEFNIRENNAKGKVLANVKMTVLSEQGRFRRDMSNQWLTLTSPLEYIPNGISDLCITCEGEAVDVDWVMFKNRPKYFKPVANGATSITPDNEGYIRRWLLLEPIHQDIRSNVVFTDTWLNEAFSKNYFKNQLTILPKNGQKVKVDKQTLTWHALDSENYNVKVFRFADGLKKQTYGVLFWAVTIIDCPEGMENVRLAAGSNGASKWWLNGEEVLMLSGDRRMVEDDGVSKRLTLKPGCNVLRCAVINGPGLSDFCARFIDEKGKPVTQSFTITVQ